MSSERNTGERLGDRLVARGLLATRNLERALHAQQETGGLFGKVLVSLGLVSELDVARVLSEQLGVPVVSADDYPAVLPEVEGLRTEFLHAALVCPLKVEGNVLTVAMAQPQDAFTQKGLHLATALEIRPVLGLESDIEEALRRSVLVLEDAEEDAGEGGSEGADFVEHLRDLATEAPVIRLVSSIVNRVVDLRASDIHLEPFEDGLHVRYRVDGILQPVESVPGQLAAAVVSRVKLLAHLNIAERRLPQDGRIRMRVKGKELDLRVSCLPTVHGESVVMRVLDRSSVRFGLEEMGFSPDNLAGFSALLERPHGILLVTGPTGSGKTTTLYAALSKLDATSLKIVTVEDPVEYQLEGINQIHVHPQIGLTFASALRAILRQDPDIIMIGEMRDGETAQIAVQSALTGHLVLSTLHTNTAAGAIVRLQDMGVERYLLTSSVNGVLAQRLVRRLCPHCKERAHLPQGVLGHALASRYLPAGEVYVAKGCGQCKGSGYLGRSAIHELIVLDTVLLEAINRGEDSVSLQALARERGMASLFEDGLRKVAAGETTLDEVMRVTQDQNGG
ncbi:GspE/PulE family protein [Thauera sp. WH-2]|jgi:general secretion pathway protein E|uniref:GspE/PulE family protein n=1 Tax=Thauera sp. WH-2 TaxID=3401574 RepID=UPI003AADA36D